MRVLIISIVFVAAAMAQAVPDSPSSTRERYLDKPNIVLLTSLTLWQGLDAYKTDHTLDEGGPKGDMAGGQPLL